jgi:hypothetical protein
MKTHLDVRNEEALLDFLLDRGYDDCTRVKRTILEEKVRERIEGGESVPGCIIAEEEVPQIKIDQALVDAAGERACKELEHAATPA